MLMATAEPPDIVILAAGGSESMNLDHPQALHPVFFRPMIHYALDAAMALPHRSVTVVFDRGERELREQCRAYPEVRFTRRAADEGGALTLRADTVEGIVVGDFHALWRVETILRERFNRALMIGGTALQDPLTTLIDPRCRIGPGVRIEGGCTLINSTLEQGARVESGCRIVDSHIGRGTVLRQGTCVERAKIGRGCQVGPYFIGDARTGRGVTIEDDVFIGGAAQAIAPVAVGAGSFVATGTSVTEDAPPGSFVISRGRQVTKPGYAKKHGKAPI